MEAIKICAVDKCRALVFEYGLFTFINSGKSEGSSVELGNPKCPISTAMEINRTDLQSEASEN